MYTPIVKRNVCKVADDQGKRDKVYLRTNGDSIRPQISLTRNLSLTSRVKIKDGVNGTDGFKYQYLLSVLPLFNGLAYPIPMIRGA